MDHIPEEALLNIMCYLDASSLLKLSLTCRHLRILGASVKDDEGVESLSLHRDWAAAVSMLATGQWRDDLFLAAADEQRPRNISISTFSVPRERQTSAVRSALEHIACMQQCCDHLLCLLQRQASS